MKDERILRVTLGNPEYSYIIAMVNSGPENGDMLRVQILFDLQNTAEDARVMSWWDYGYQIAGMANRTTLGTVLVFL